MTKNLFISWIDFQKFKTKFKINTQKFSGILKKSKVESVKKNQFATILKIAIIKRALKYSLQS